MDTKRVWIPLCGLALHCGMTSIGMTQFKPNYDEAQVPHYALPNALVGRSGERVSTARQWRESRRAEVLRLFQQQVYGRSPEPSPAMRFEIASRDERALSGAAVRKQVDVLFTGSPDGPQMRILIYLPKAAKGPVPMFLGLNFGGNHTVRSEPGIALSTSWMRPGEGVENNRATEQTRGAAAGRWAVEKILERGYGLATIYYGDIDPDYHDGFQDGVHPAFYKEGQTRPAADEWGSIAAWAWGLSRAMDFFETDQTIDHRRVAVIGHSRLGKTSLWAGAQDLRFALLRQVVIDAPFPFTAECGVSNRRMSDRQSLVFRRRIVRDSDVDRLLRVRCTDGLCRLARQVYGRAWSTADGCSAAACSANGRASTDTAAT